MELQDYLKGFLHLTRQRAEGEPAAVLEHLPSPVDLTPPCQLTGFSFDLPTPFQAILITHSKTAPDAQIVCHEGIQTWEPLDVFERVLEDPLWKDEIPDHPDGLLTHHGYVQTLRGDGQRMLLTLDSHVRYYARAKPPDRPGSHLWASGEPHCMVMYHHGPLDEIDFSRFVERSFKEAETRAEESQKPQDPLPVTYVQSMEEQFQRYRGRGAFHVPGLQIGRVDELPLRDLIGMDSLRPGWKVFDGQLGGYEFLATHNGFFGLIIKDDHEALRWLNLLMAALLSKGYPARAVREQDLARFQPPDDQSGSWGGMYPRERDWRDSGIRGGWDQYHLHPPELEPLLRETEAIAGRPYADQVPVFLEAYSHLVGSEPTQSFVFSWALIEQHMSNLWHAYLEERKVGSKRKKRLEWNLHHRAETLQLAGRLDTDTLNELRKVKDARNAVMHGERQATEADAKAALDLAEHMIIGDGPPLRGTRQPSPWESGLVRLL